MTVTATTVPNACSPQNFQMPIRQGVERLRTHNYESGYMYQP